MVCLFMKTRLGGFAWDGVYGDLYEGHILK